MLPLVSCWEWYPEQKGLLTGVIVCAYGLSSFIFAPIILRMVNPMNMLPGINITHDLKLFDHLVTDKFPEALRHVLHIWTIQLVISILTISRPVPQEEISLTVGKDMPTQKYDDCVKNDSNEMSWESQKGNSHDVENSW